MFPTRYRDPISDKYLLPSITYNTPPPPPTTTTHEKQNQKERKRTNFLTRPVQWSQLCNSGTNHHDSTHARCIPSSPHAACLLIAEMPGEQTPFLPFRRSTPPRYKISQKGQETTRKLQKHPPPPSQDSLQQIVVVVVPTKKHAKHTDANARRHSTIIITITSSTCPSPCPSSPPQPPPQQRLPWSTDSPCRCRTAPGRPCRHSP